MADFGVLWTTRSSYLYQFNTFGRRWVNDSLDCQLPTHYKKARSEKIGYLEFTSTKGNNRLFQSISGGVNECKKVQSLSEQYYIFDKLISQLFLNCKKLLLIVSLKVMLRDQVELHFPGKAEKRVRYVNID